jgi:hypothetical protein
MANAPLLLGVGTPTRFAIGHLSSGVFVEGPGGGFDLNGFRGRLNIGALVPGFDSALTSADEVVSTTNPWSITTYAICAER